MTSTPLSIWCPIAGRRVGVALALALLAFMVASPFAAAQTGGPNPNVRPPAGAVNTGPGDAVRPGNLDAEMWRKLRAGIEGKVSIPDKKAGLLVQSGGETWRNLRRGPLPIYGAYVLAGMLALLALFYVIRGRIRIEKGFAGRTITRFTDVERMGHWLLAVSFILLALTGLNVLYGRDVLLPLLGKSTFATLTDVGRTLHHYVGFAFMAGLLLTFLMWVGHNFPTRHDVAWLAHGGGLFTKGDHPPARKFNAGQKILFWLIMIGGLLMTVTGLSLLLPFEWALASRTFAHLNAVGLGLPTSLFSVEEMQYVATAHSIIALLLVCVILGHIYIGTLGMEGAFAAMGSGEVDINWAREHHSLWVDEVMAEEGKEASAGGRVAPAE